MANLTITFGQAKPAQVLSPSRQFCGELRCVDIGFPEAAVHAAMAGNQPHFHRILPAAILQQNPWSTLPTDAHKYDRGHVLVIGGSPGKYGAPVLTGLAALRTGAGWVSLALPDPAWHRSNAELPLEFTFEDFFDQGLLDAAALRDFVNHRRVRCVVIGPGTMQNPLHADVIKVLQQFQSQAGGFVVLDAGALHRVADLFESAPLNPLQTILLPHPGEWQKLGIPLPPPLTLSALRPVSEQLRQWGCTISYKGATPILLEGGKPQAWIVDNGTKALARAGSGDVLAGSIAAHGAVGLTALHAAARAHVLEAKAANLAAADVGIDAVLASDIILHLGRVVPG